MLIKQSGKTYLYNPKSNQMKVAKGKTWSFVSDEDKKIVLDKSKNKSK
jgi:hypothetical protein